MRSKRMHSNALQGAAYDQRHHVLVVFFRSGTAYRYADVPERLFDELVEAASKGQYYQANIRNRFRYERLSAPEVERVKARFDMPGGEGRAWVKDFLEETRADGKSVQVFV
jgi:hypothetical protein